MTSAFLQGEPAALHVFEWSGPQLLAAEAIAASRRGHVPYPHHPSTALGAALLHAARSLQEAPDCSARTIDISGDGESSDGISPAAAYAILPFDGVTVNALIVEDGSVDGEGLLEWFQSEVLHGPGAFCILADGYEDFERAMTAKLLRELELPMASGLLPEEPRG